MSVGEKATRSLPLFGDFIRAMVGQPQIDERRKSQRVGILSVVPATPVDEAGRPVGATFQAVTHNISAGGIALLVNEDVTARFLELELATPDVGSMKFQLEVLRTRALQPWCYEVAGRFVTAPAN
jgi:c-di-GMP-binding flagellar brake protein YcgR